MYTCASTVQVSSRITTASASSHCPQQRGDMQKRGGKGKSGGKLKSDDAVNLILTGMAHDTLLVIANDGACFSLRAFEVPERARTAQGSQLAELLPKFPKGVGVATIVPLRAGAGSEASLLLVTRQGKAKRLSLDTLKCAHPLAVFGGCWLAVRTELRGKELCK